METDVGLFIVLAFWYEKCINSKNIIVILFQSFWLRSWVHIKLIFDICSLKTKIISLFAGKLAKAGALCLFFLVSSLDLRCPSGQCCYRLMVFVFGIIVPVHRHLCQWIYNGLFYGFDIYKINFLCWVKLNVLIMIMHSNVHKCFKTKE